MKKVVIVGAGLGSRLYPITKCIPKVLVNYKQHTILKHLYLTWTSINERPDEIIVIVSSKMKKIVEGYCRIHDLDVIVETCDSIDGSAVAIDSIKHKITGHNIVFNWCDIIPNISNDFKWDSNVIYTSGTECRYNYDGVNFTAKQNGNVIGLYQIEKMPIFQISPHNKDFADMIISEPFINGLSFSKIDINVIDIGDMAKLHSAHKYNEINREFNKIIFSNNTVKKIAMNDQGVNLLNKELNWYSNVADSDKHLIPKIISKSNNWFEMDNIKMPSAYKYISNLPDNEKIAAVKLLVSKCRFTQDNNKVVPSDKQDVYIEANLKVLTRSLEIKPLLDGFSNNYPIKYVNGIKLQSLEQLLESAFTIITKKSDILSKPYSFIHGDLNLSNIFFDGNSVKIIDPRGYFGSSKLYGPIIYDEAKILYGLSGYDEFNSDYAWGGLERFEDNLIIQINEVIPFNDTPFSIFHKIWVSIIWISLAGYFKNNPLKSISAYYYGIYLLQTTLNQYNNNEELNRLRHELIKILNED